MKKFLLLSLLAVAGLLLAAPESQAGVRVGIGIGLPAVTIGYPAYYPAPYYAPAYYAPAPVVVGGYYRRPYYGGRVYYAPRRTYIGGRVVYRGR